MLEVFLTSLLFNGQIYRFPSAVVSKFPSVWISAHRQDMRAVPPRLLLPNLRHRRGGSAPNTGVTQGSALPHPAVCQLMVSHLSVNAEEAELPSRPRERTYALQWNAPTRFHPQEPGSLFKSTRPRLKEGLDYLKPMTLNSHQPKSPKQSKAIRRGGLQQGLKWKE